MPNPLLAPTPMPPRWRSLVAEAGEAHLDLSLEGRPLIRLRLVPGAVPALHLQTLCADRPQQGLWAACYWWFARHPDCQRLVWHLPAEQIPALSASLACGLLLATEQTGRFTCERGLFWQLPQPWLGDAPRPLFPAQMLFSQGKRHPRRAPKPSGEVYRRYDSRLGAWVSLRSLDLAQDLERFNRWQNTPRVLAFWDEGGTLEQHQQYLQRLHDDPHALTLIGCFNDQPFAYFEAYWAKEDRIAPFYDVDDYDRGMHMLVGEDAHRGPHKVASWMPALVHYLFLDDPRTQRVVAEPRADNQRMISYMEQVGFHCDKAFDFPHKRAALMVLGRERFFDHCRLS
ncbi:GNAT family N-acetyltransferase [Pseudomonas sp. RP23018S]|uniref:GNAT family N-acetyltransferase n=1 Tax=Pseudomonas sp. RP23018S TaxID=3096037 RepID=UPI002ACAB13F|nr:GNAT family N-acetyltransferase [Pseudomonas sp. RP23018S]MDZ5602337.1 GNAT family N-acetyltransferase [Pseudomonas sp. RP23018S]